MAGDPADKQFQGFVVRQMGNGVSLSRPGDGNDNPTIVFTTPLNLDLLDDRVGYLAVSVPIESIAKALPNPAIRKMLEWVVKSRSKLRFTSHGDGEGNVEMPDSVQQMQSMSADCIAQWLYANNLTSKGELATISVNICMAAKHNLTPAVLKAGKYTPAEHSAVALLAAKLGELGIHGVTVTGSNEVVDAKEKPGYTRTPISGLLEKNAQGFRQIGIPQGFTFEPGSLKVTIPDGWSITQRAFEQSQLCVITAPREATLSATRSTRRIMQADGTTRDVTIASADYTIKSATGDVQIPSDGWIVNDAQKEVIAAEGWQRLDARTMKFAGTGGNSALESNQGVYKIVERLAKSQAKAVAVS
jgi:hypothetical protein